jgi:hypothetical protein
MRLAIWITLARGKPAPWCTARRGRMSREHPPCFDGLYLRRGRCYRLSSPAGIWRRILALSRAQGRNCAALESDQQQGIQNDLVGSASPKQRNPGLCETVRDLEVARSHPGSRRLLGASCSSSDDDEPLGARASPPAPAAAGRRAARAQPAAEQRAARGAAGAAGSGAVGVASCPEGVLFCDDFEGAALGAVSAPWRESTNNATVAVDTLQAFSGTQAVRPCPSTPRRRAPTTLATSRSTTAPPPTSSPVNAAQSPLSTFTP